MRLSSEFFGRDWDARNGKQARTSSSRCKIQGTPSTTAPLVNIIHFYLFSNFNSRFMAASKAQKQTASKDAATTASGAIQGLWKSYSDDTPTKLKTIDAFLVFIMLSGIIQFVYCVAVTNFPFNAFLAGYVHALDELRVPLRGSNYGTSAVTDSRAPLANLFLLHLCGRK